MNPKYPIYIVTKGRYDYRITSRSLDALGVPYQIIIEEQEYDDYAKYHPESDILVLPQRFKEEYEVCDEFGLTKSTGPGPARNFAWETAKELGHRRHWVMDDNIGAWYRLNRNIRSKVTSGTMFRCAEDFVDRYNNVPVSGLNYRMFAVPDGNIPPYVMNTRIYSCLLIENKWDYRWRGRYNEDTILSLDVLKDGLCTVQFNAFLADKGGTQQIKGGNSTEFYFNEGTNPKSQMIEDVHPDVSKVMYRFSRIHHYVDYSPFKHNKLIRTVDVKPGINNYGMELRTINKEGEVIDE